MFNNFDYLGGSADFNLDGHVDPMEASLFFHMMEMEDAEFERKFHLHHNQDDDMDFDEDL